jgi:chromosome partitioning protein
MKVIAMAAQKGGSGKTTVALHLAVEAQKQGLSVAVIDADPQGSAKSWADQREDGAAVPVALVAVEAVERALAAAEQDGYDLVVIDTPPHASVRSQHLIAHADLVVIPVQPSALDLAALPAMLSLIRPGTAPHRAVISAAPVGVAEVAQIRDALANYQVEAFETVIHSRMAFRRALAHGQAVAEFEPKGKAAGEVASLWAEAAELLQLATPAQEAAHV